MKSLHVGIGIGHKRPINYMAALYAFGVMVVASCIFAGAWSWAHPADAPKDAGLIQRVTRTYEPLLVAPQSVTNNNPKIQKEREEFKAQQQLLALSEKTSEKGQIKFKVITGNATLDITRTDEEKFLKDEGESDAGKMWEKSLVLKLDRSVDITSLKIAASCLSLVEGGACSERNISSYTVVDWSTSPDGKSWNPVAGGEVENSETTKEFEIDREKAKNTRYIKILAHFRVDNGPPGKYRFMLGAIDIGGLPISNIKPLV